MFRTIAHPGAGYTDSGERLQTPSQESLGNITGVLKVVPVTNQSNGSMQRYGTLFVVSCNLTLTSGTGVRVSPREPWSKGSECTTLQLRRGLAAASSSVITRNQKPFAVRMNGHFCLCSTAHFCHSSQYVRLDVGSRVRRD